MRISGKLVIVLVLVSVLPSMAADFAILRNGFSIRHERREAVGPTTRLYVSSTDDSFVDVPTSEIDRFERDLSPAPAGRVSQNSQSLPELVNTASGRYHLDPDLVNSVIHAESGFNPNAVSPKGAQGLMQLMPRTAGQLGVTDALDPRANVDGGTRYLRELLERYNFDLIKALAAYNAGPQRVDQYRGVPPFRETRAYVARIVHEYNTKKIAQEKAEKQKLAAAKKASTQATKKTASATHRPSKPATTAIAAESER